MEPKIVFEDEQILLIDKPAGMIVNKADTTKNVETMQDWVEQNYQITKLPNCEFENQSDFVKRAGIVHRIDKETSGLLLIAKTEEAFNNLQAQFKERKVKKRYLALAHGKLAQKEGEINAPVGRLPWNRERFGVFPEGKDAKTNYKVIKEIANLPVDATHQALQTGGEDLSLVELTPETGRTHQIRVHMQFLGHPLVGDEFYAGRKQARDDRKWCPRVFLHASYIGFFHPKTGDWIEFNCDLPVELNLPELNLNFLLNERSQNKIPAKHIFI
jgi:23S rRNA pseudouridine1911/1915/1917 synthase